LAYILVSNIAAVKRLMLTFNFQFRWLSGANSTTGQKLSICVAVC